MYDFERIINMSEKVFCNNCGTENCVEDRFCGFCGNLLIKESNKKNESLKTEYYDDKTLAYFYNDNLNSSSNIQNDETQSIYYNNYNDFENFNQNYELDNYNTIDFNELNNSNEHNNDLNYYNKNASDVDTNNNSSNSNAANWIPDYDAWKVISSSNDVYENRYVAENNTVRNETNDEESDFNKLQNEYAEKNNNSTIKINNSGNTNLFKSVVLLVISVIMLGLAFLPVGKYEIPYVNYDAEISISVSAVDRIILFFNSFKNYTDVDFKQTELQSEVSRHIENINEWFSDAGEVGMMPKNIQSELEDYYNKSMLMSYQDVNYELKISDVLCFLTALIYIITAAAFLVLSILNFIRIRKQDDSLMKNTYLLLTMMPAALIVFFASVRITFCYIPNYDIGACLLKVSLGAILTIIIAFSAIAALIVMNRASLEIKKVLTAVVSMVLCIISICVTFLPVFKTELKGTPYSANEPIRHEIELYADIYYNLDYSDSTKDYYDTLSNKSYGEKKREIEGDIKYIFNWYNANAIEKGETDALQRSLALKLFNIEWENKKAPIFAVSAILYVLFVILCVLSFTLDLYSMIVNEASKKMTTIFSIISFALTLIILLFNILFCLEINYNLEIFSISNFSCALAIGAILLPIATFVSSGFSILTKVLILPKNN